MSHASMGAKVRTKKKKMEAYTRKGYTEAKERKPTEESPHISLNPYSFPPIVSHYGTPAIVYPRCLQEYCYYL
jgi:hypothetical protein